MTQGSQLGPTQSTSTIKPAGQRVKACRRLAAGEARRGGGSAISRSDDKMGGGECLRVAGSKPQRLVVMVGFGVVGNIVGDDLGGRRSRVNMNSRLRDTARHVVRCVGLLGMP